MQDILPQITQFETLIAATAGFMIGALIVTVIALLSRQKLATQNAELKAQVKAEKLALETAGAALDARFKDTAQTALSQSSERFLQLAKEKLNAAQADSSHDLEKRQKAIADLVDPVNKALKTMDEKIGHLETARTKAYAELETHLKSMTEDQMQLRKETATLVQALRSPSTRGQWGEMQLKRCLDMAGMIEGVHYEQQVTANSGQRPDVIVKLSGGQSLVIDSKAPLEGYLDAIKEGASEDERRTGLARHARHVKDHIKQLGSKSYWEQFDTPEFVVMFLPGESYFSAALETDPSLIESGVDQKVIPATPTTLISLLKAVMYGWRQEQLAENAREVSALGADLYKSLGAFAGHVQKVGRGLGTAMNAYNDAIGSLERNVLPKARKFDELQVSSQIKDIETLDPVEHSIRSLNAPEVSSSKPETEPETEAEAQPSTKAKKRA